MHKVFDGLDMVIMNVKRVKDFSFFLESRRKSVNIRSNIFSMLLNETPKVIVIAFLLYDAHKV